MKLLFSLLLCSTASFASLDIINSFQADFTQKVTDDRNATLNYSGNLAAQKPQNAVWHYKLPITKDVYMDKYRVTIVEPEIEQVIIRKVETKFDFFNMIQNAKKLDSTTYEAYYKEARYIIKTDKNLISSISYKDNFDNDVKILFKNQKQNIKINEEIFMSDYPSGFDVIRD